MISASIFEAKTNLAELVRQAQSGETVIITSGREKTPVARIEAIVPDVQQRLGAWEKPGFYLEDSFWEPLSEQECGTEDDLAR